MRGRINKIPNFLDPRGVCCSSAVVLDRWLKSCTNLDQVKTVEGFIQRHGKEFRLCRWCEIYIEALLLEYMQKYNVDPEHIKHLEEEWKD